MIAITAPGGGFWTPNGLHRLEAMRRLGARSIAALTVPDRQVAWQILALNTEKAHNLKDAALVTLGLCYEMRLGFAGGAYHPVLRRLEAFAHEPLKVAVREHQERAGLVLALEEKVAKVIARLKQRGFRSPYLRAFVVARINLCAGSRASRRRWNRFSRTCGTAPPGSTSRR